MKYAWIKEQRDDYSVVRLCLAMQVSGDKRGRVQLLGIIGPVPVSVLPGVTRRLRDATQVGRFHVAKEFSYKTTKQAGDGWVLVGDAGGFIDPIYSTGVYLALKSGMLAGEAVVEGLGRNDVSEKMLGRWTQGYESGVDWLRKLVRVFYTNEFSFGSFMKAHPEHGENLTDLLVGRVFEGNPGAIFKTWIRGWKKSKQARRFRRSLENGAVHTRMWR